MVELLLIWVLWRSAGVLISYLATIFVPYLGFFSYADTMATYGLPSFIQALSNFDGIFYIRIALNGYSSIEQAFFPLYPLLIRLINPLLPNPIITGIAITNIAFFLALIVLYKYLQLNNEKKSSIFWLIGFLITYPTAFFFGVMYTESIFLLFFFGSLFFLKKKLFFLAFLFAYLIGLTRVNGIFLSIPLLLMSLEQIKQAQITFRGQIWKYLSYVVVSLAPVLGLASYCFYLWRAYEDPLYFFHAQEDFGANRSTKIILLPQVIYRYIKIFLTADHNFQYLVAVLEFAFFFLAFSLLVWDLKKMRGNRKMDLPRLGLNIFSWINLILPTLTGTLTSIPRYSLLCFSMYFVLAEIKNKAVKIILMILLSVLQIVMYSLFVQGYYTT